MIFWRYKKSTKNNNSIWIYKCKRQNALKRSSLFANRGILTSYGTDNVTIEKQVVGVALGKWIETLRVDQFQFISKAFSNIN